MLDYDCNAVRLNIDVTLAKTADNALRFHFRNWTLWGQGFLVRWKELRTYVMLLRLLRLSHSEKSEGLKKVDGGRAQNKFHSIHWHGYWIQNLLNAAGTMSRLPVSGNHMCSLSRCQWRSTSSSSLGNTLRRFYTGPPGWSTRLNQRNWIQRLNDTVYTVPQRWTRQSISKWRQMNLCGKVLWYVTI